MRQSRRFHVVLSAQLDADIRSFAQRHGLSLAGAVRSLIERSLCRNGTADAIARQETPASLAILVATEQALLAVASVLPDGEQRIAGLASRAVEAAEARLALFRDAGE